MIRLQISKHASPKDVNRIKKKLRVRRKIEGSPERPRLSIFRSSRNFVAQIIDDRAGRTLVSASTLKSDKGANKDAAKELGQQIASLALKAKIEQVVFDRNGYLYHGKIKAFADGAREAGLKF